MSFRTAEAEIPLKQLVYIRKRWHRLQICTTQGIPDECKDCIMEECDFLKDLITMLTCIMIERFGVIRDYLYERDENDEYFFGIPKDNRLEVYLLTSPEDLYEYLAEESEGFSLIAKKETLTN